VLHLFAEAVSVIGFECHVSQSFFSNAEELESGSVLYYVHIGKKNTFVKQWHENVLVLLTSKRVSCDLRIRFVLFAERVYNLYISRIFRRVIIIYMYEYIK
jgi:hypothetical protein